MFKIIDCNFNWINYPNLVGKYCIDPPAYARVAKIEPYRKHSCWYCHHEWLAKVEKEAFTVNISGEKTQYCPKCFTAASCSSAWVDSDGNDWDFKEY